jgi:beta-glucosidase
MTQSQFPNGFLWGAATSAYQIEGSPLVDGAAASNWHAFSHQPGRIADGSTGDVACDHYRRAAEDVALMASLGLRAYRFSIAWSRVIPQGVGAVNPGGLAFYDRLVDDLLARGIEPMVTLHHWDLPLRLAEHGGWLSPDSPSWFAGYADAVFHALGDRVKLWITLNEPLVITHAGYIEGVHPPARCSPADALRATTNLLLAHAQAVRAYRAAGRHAIGVTVNLEAKYPASDAEEDVASTQHAHAYMNRQFLDPLFTGRYPAEFDEIFGEAVVAGCARGLEQARQPIDFLGVNYYSREVVRARPATQLRRLPPERIPGAEYTDMDWEVYPCGLDDILQWVTRTYGRLPLYVTENGAAFSDPPPRDNIVDDPRRVAYLRDHLRAAASAIDAGVDLRGYFVWSLLDNFEWTLGYSRRFGIVHVDYATQRRTPKQSARFYADVIRSNGALLFDQAV